MLIFFGIWGYMCVYGFRFMLCADYEAYIKCQEKVSQMYTVRAQCNQYTFLFQIKFLLCKYWFH